MTKVLHDVEALVGLLGLKRSDARLRTLIGHFGGGAVSTMNKDDDVLSEHVVFKEQGFALYFENDTLDHIFLYSGQKDSGFVRYGCPLPLGVRFEQSKSEALGLLGSPEASGGGCQGTFGYVPDWIRYQAEGYMLHLGFASDSRSIRMVTIMLRCPGVSDHL